MEQIPTEVMDEVNRLFPNIGGEISDEGRANFIAGYQYALALCEGKEKEIAELKAEKAKLVVDKYKLFDANKELEAEKERLKGLLLKSYPTLMFYYRSKGQLLENKLLDDIETQLKDLIKTANNL